MKTLTPIEKLEAHIRVPLPSSASRRKKSSIVIDGSSGAGREIHPVVPQTTGTSALKQRSMLAAAVAGVVNSMATSELRNSSVSKSERLSLSMRQVIVSPRWRAMRSMIWPILPYPMIAIFVMFCRQGERMLAESREGMLAELRPKIEPRCSLLETESEVVDVEGEPFGADVCLAAAR